MPVTPEQAWTLVGCGLVAHADDTLDVGEWDQVLAMVEEDLGPDDESEWTSILMDRVALEERFRDLELPPESAREAILERCWRMALADGSGTEVESAVHDRIADRLAIALDRAAEIREYVAARVADRAVIVIGLAAVMANLDGRLDAAEASQFDALLERAPLPVHRRLDLAAQLHEPPTFEEVVERLAALSEEDRLAAMRELAPMVHASARGSDERAAFVDIAMRVGIARDRAQRLLDGSM